MRYQLPLDRIVVVEYLLAALNFVTCAASAPRRPPPSCGVPGATGG
jgi:hypothetical protein